MIDYTPLWESLDARGIVPNHMVISGVINSATLAKMRKGGGVHLSTIEKICVAYDLPIENVVAIRKA